MIKVVKGNVVLRVEDNMLDYYVDRGYTAKQLDGTLIKEAVPTDAASLKKAYIESKNEVNMLKKEISDLKQQIASMKGQMSIEKATTLDEKPKRTRRKSFEEE